MLLKETSRRFLTLNSTVYSTLGFGANKIKKNPDFSNHLAKSKLVRIIGKSEKSGVTLQLLTVEGKFSLVRIIGNSEKQSVR